MGSPARSPQIVHFANYILDVQTAELRRNGTKSSCRTSLFKFSPLSSKHKAVSSPAKN